MSHPLESSRTEVTRLQRYHYAGEPAPYVTFVHIKVDGHKVKVFSARGTTPGQANDECMDKAVEFVQDLLGE